MTTLLLARHGETDWNRDRRWQGRRGVPLNETGRRQAEELAATVSGLDAIYSSDAERARETAAIVARRHGLEVATDARLGEVDFGRWEGLTRAEIEERFGPESDHGGEDDVAMAERVLAALTEIADRHPDDRVLVVTSGGPIRAAEAHLQGIEQAEARNLLRTVSNCSLVEVVVRDGAWSAA